MKDFKKGADDQIKRKVMKSRKKQINSSRGVAQKNGANSPDD